MRAIIYARCSTDENRQDVNLQVGPCKEYCDKEGWTYDIVKEYSSGWKGFPEKLVKVLDLIMNGTYQVLIVYNIDRFSRSSPRKVMKVILQLLEKKCRFIALQNNLDSNDEFMFNAFIMWWTTFSNMYSKQLSERIKLGMQKARDEGKPIGRPLGSRDKRKRSKKGYYGNRRKIKLDY